jgi:hypothetical protein
MNVIKQKHDGFLKVVVQGRHNEERIGKCGRCQLREKFPMTESRR